MAVIETRDILPKQDRQILVGKVGRASEFGLPNVLDRYGFVERYVSGGGDSITVLPTSDVPREYFLRERWTRVTQMGNVRSVRAIESLDDGVRPGLVAKSPERVFTTSERQLKVENVWWGGSRSGEGAIKIENNPVVEEQSVWEGAILLELLSRGFKAEVPQALIQRPSGQTELVVKEIRSDSKAERNGPSYAQIIREVLRTTSLVPEDSTQFNCMRDEEGQEQIIDVNRWSWSPDADGYKGALVDTVREAISGSVRSRMAAAS